MVDGVKGYHAESNVFRPEILERIDRVYIFEPQEEPVLQPQDETMLAEFALYQISELAKEYGLSLEFVAPELITKALFTTFCQFGCGEMERIVLEFARDFFDAKKGGATRVQLAVANECNIVIRNTTQSENVPLNHPNQMPDETK
jgi:hypothetical protein